LRGLKEIDLEDSPDVCIRTSEAFKKAILGASSLVFQESATIQAKFARFHELSVALLIRTILCKEGQIGARTKSVGDRISLIATFVQGMTCTRDLILGGYHYKAAGALKQDVRASYKDSGNKGGSC
jgi:hypothetical protein